MKMVKWLQKQLIKNSQPNGPAKIYDENGKLAVEFNLVNGKAEGLLKTYYPSGKVRTEENYKNDEREELLKLMMKMVS